MKTPISSKLAIFAAALMMNGLIIAGVNYLFKAPMRQHTGEIALAHANGDSAVADHGRATTLDAERRPRISL
jgi:hypothetical protein